MARARARAMAEMDDVELTWVCSRTQRRAEEFLQALAEDGVSTSSVTAADDWRGAIARGDVDGVVITTPNSEHFAPVAAALEANRHVLVEYPSTVTAAETQELLDLAARKHRALHVGLTYRYSAMHQALRELLYPAGVVPGALGRPLAYLLTVCSGRDISRWYDKETLSGGAFVSSFYHYIAEAADLLGPVADVHARYVVHHRRDGAIRQDCGTLMLSFESGCAAQIMYARGCPPPGLGSNTTILCEKGYLVISGGKIRKLTPEGEETIEPSGPSSVLGDTQAFVDASRGEWTADPTGLASLAALRVAGQAAECAGGGGPQPA